MSTQTVLPTMIRRFTAFRVPSSIRPMLPALLLVLAFVLPPVLVGGIGGARELRAQQIEPPPALNQPLPDRPAHDPSKRTAVIVAGNASTESSDLMGPYETLMTSGQFNVYVAAPERMLSPLFPGDLSIVPHYGFAEYDATFSGPPDLVVVPYIPDAEGAVLRWIHEQADAGSTILSICAGAAVVADAGVLGGQTATTHHYTMSSVLRSHPEVNWVRGFRYVDSGQFISSAGVTSGVDATLYTLSRMFGREVAEPTAQAMAYPHLRFLDDPTWTQRGLSPVPLIPTLFRLDRTEIGLVLYSGVRELEVSSAIDTYPRAFATSIRTLAPERAVIRTRHGLDLVPRSDFARAPALDRLLVPGRGLAPEAMADLQSWTAQHGGLTVESIHAGDGYLYDLTLRDIARHDSTSVAIEAANVLEYPTRDLQLDGPAVRLDLLIRPLALALLGLGAALWLRRRPRPGIWSFGRFVLHFAEMTLAMVAGMAVFHVIAGGHGHGAASAIPSTVQQAGMLVFMTVPMVAWMRLRGHSWRHGTEMAVGMLAPAVVIYLLLGLGAAATLPWLEGADHPVMLLGMIVAMLLRREHYAGGHASAATPPVRLAPATT
jgi:AraC family transcriptional regulator, transcriptional activator FtrA